VRCKSVVATFLLLIAGCRKEAREGYQRLAIPQFENLTGEKELDWWGPALAELMAAAATGTPRVHPLRVPSWWDAPAARATHILHGSIWRAGSRFRVEATLENMRRGRVEKVAVVEEQASAGPSVLADRLAAKLGLHARSVGSYKSEAVRAYVEAASSRDPASLLEKAIAADPAFGLPYLQLVRLRAMQGDRVAVEALLERARQAGVDAVERTRLELMESGYRGDAETYRRALDALARLTPADPDVWQALALRLLAARDIAGAVRHLQKALARDPQNPFLLNEAGYALAYAGDFGQAVKLLLRYRQLLPSDPNPPDSLGDIFFQMGNFAQAESYYRESAEKSSDFAASGSLLKGAWARWLRGDRQGADERAADYFRQREAAKDPLVELRKAQWEYLTGRSRRALERLRQMVAVGPSVELQALASAFLAAWSLEQGDREQARRYAEAATRGASPQARELARMSLFLSDAAMSPQELTRLAEQAFPRPEETGLRETALAYALLLGGHFREALSVLNSLIAKSPPSPSETLPVMLAWAALESGRDPARWLQRWPVPDSRLPNPFDFLCWPRVIYLQAVARETQGDAAQARALYGLFLGALGDRPGHDRERSRAAGKAGS
jgi:tetratricopeptide (TPR) repeat protein